MTLTVDSYKVLTLVSQELAQDNAVNLMEWVARSAGRSLGLYAGSIWTTDILTDATNGGTASSAGTPFFNLVTDEQPRNDADSATAVVAEAGVNIVLNAYGYLADRIRFANLTWTGAYASTADIYRNGGLIRTTNTGAYTDTIVGRGAGTFTYKVCEIGTATCSNTASVVF